MMFTKFDDIQVGDKAEFERKISSEDIDLFAKITGDFNPLHTDEEFAKVTRFGGRIAHGMLTSSFISRAIGMSLPGTGALYLSQYLEFFAPVRIGDKIKVMVTVQRKHEGINVLSLNTEIFNQEGAAVVNGNAKVMVMVDPKAAKDKVKEDKKGAAFTDRPYILKEGGSNMDLKGKVVLVTGSGRGIGAEITRVLSSAGASVIINYVKDSESANKIADDINKDNPGRAIVVKADVSDSIQVRKMFSDIRGRFGEIDVLVNNASPSLDNKGLLSSDWSDFEKHINTLVKGAYNCSLEAVESMKKKGRGKIVNILSSIIYKPQRSMASYITAKFGLLGMTKSMALELAPFNITVNSISPGMTDTALMAHLPDNVKKVAGAKLPLKRIATPTDIARVVEFLISDYADYLTGVDIPVCGGENII